MRAAIGLIVGGAILVGPASARAQQSAGDVLRFLVENQDVQTGDFERDRAAADAAADALSRAVRLAVATLPIGAAPVGLTYRFNPALGTLERTGQTFGPSFLERAGTAGEGTVAFGASWQYAWFTSLDGRPLRDATLVTTSNRFLDESEPFDVERLQLNVSSHLLTGYATVGVTDRFDVSVAVPIVSLSLEGERINTYRGEEFLQAQGTVSSSGLGDAAVRAKYRFLDAAAGGAALAGEVRLPTGSEEDLLGAGAASYRIMAVASTERGRSGFHVNGGFSFGGISDEVTYAAAVVGAPTLRLSLVAELVGRYLRQAGRIADLAAPHPDIGGLETVRLSATTGGANVMSAAVGMRWNISSNWLLSATMLVPITDVGLTTRVRPVVGLDYVID